MTYTIQPNDPCPCGSGKPYSQCCGRHTEEKSPETTHDKKRHQKENIGDRRRD